VNRRILTAILTMTTLAIVAFFVPAALAIRSAQERGEVLELQREASIAASRIPAGGPIDASMLEAVTDADARLGIYGADGRLAVGAGPAVGDRIVDIALAGNFAEGRVGDELVAAIPVRTQRDGSELVLRIEASRSSSRFARSLAELAAAGLGVIAVSTAVGIWSARRLTRPIRDLRRWATDAPVVGRSVDPPEPTGIAELDSLRGALLQDRERIDELVRRERSFSSHVSHQLRTPVAAMRVAIETELGSPRDDPSVVLDESLEQLDRLESTITGLLALARHDDRPATDVDLLELATSRTGGRSRHEGRHLDVTGASVPIRTDREAVGHILEILVDNAFRHGLGTVTVTVDRVDGFGRIDVADEGSSPDDRDAFAERTADTGHGIGLRLARSLAEAIGGRLELVPRPTTTFRLSIPLDPVAAS
jgi:signal transduction histidine kinase